MRKIFCCLFFLICTTANSQQQNVCSLLSLDQEANLGLLGHTKKIEPTAAPDYFEALNTHFFTCKYTVSQNGNTSTRRLLFLSDVLSESDLAKAKALTVRHQNSIRSELPPKSEVRAADFGFCFVAPIFDGVFVGGCTGIAGRHALSTTILQPIEAKLTTQLLLAQHQELFESVVRRLAAN
jgi:hypothetical protein